MSKQFFDDSQEEEEEEDEGLEISNSARSSAYYTVMVPIRYIGRLNPFAEARLIGIRATQLEQGAEPTVKIRPGWDANDIAIEEIRRRTVNFRVELYMRDPAAVRYLAMSNDVENISTSDDIGKVLADLKMLAISDEI